MRRYEQVKITEISIKNFRSIVNMNIDVEQLNMFVGLNDVGKSNVLKALNLFFNNETDYNEKFAFESDFSQLFPQKSKKAKEIVIKIIFEVPQNYKGHGEYVWEKQVMVVAFHQDRRFLICCEKWCTDMFQLLKVKSIINCC